MAALTIAPPEKKTIEINGHMFEVRVTDLEVVDMIVDFEAGLRAVEKKLGRGKGAQDMRDAKEAADFYRSSMRGIDRMLGEGALEKIMGTASLPIAKAIEVFEAVAGGISGIYEADIKELYG